MAQPFALPEQVPLSQPKWVAVLVWAALGAALSALAFSAKAWGVGWGWLLTGAGLAVSVHGVQQHFQRRWLKDHTLAFEAPWAWQKQGSNCFLNTFSQTDRLINHRPAALQQSWAHIFGLTLRLNLRNHPHYQSETVTLTVWRCQVSVQTYRCLNVWAAWQSEHSETYAKGGAA